MRGRELALLWALAALIAVPLGVLALRAVRNLEVPPSQAFSDYNEPRIDAFAAEVEAGAFGVVLFGDSRLRNALPLQEDVAALLTEAAGSDVAVLRLVNDWAVHDDFAPLVPSILAAEPDLVIVQEELRERHRGLDASELLQREYLWWKLFGRGAWSPGDRSQDYLQLSADCAEDEGVAERLVRVERWLSFDPAGPTAIRHQRFIDDLDRRDVAYRFLDIPVTTDAAAGLPGIDPTDGPLGLGPDISIDDTHFCDIVHLGPSGRDLFTDWFVDEVAPVVMRSTT